MNLKFVSKNNLGVVATLILVIMLSQSRLFDFLTDTSFGRLSLLALIILIACTHKILGLVAVLLVIIAFNYNDANTVYSYNFYEGFQDGSGNLTDGSGNPIIQAKIDTIQAKAVVKENKAAAITNKLNANSQTTANTSTTTETFNGKEGFCMSDRELNMLRGKPSNTIPVYNKSRAQPDEVDPIDKSIFTGAFASF